MTYALSDSVGLFATATTMAWGRSLPQPARSFTGGMKLELPNRAVGIACESERESSHQHSNKLPESSGRSKLSFRRFRDKHIRRLCGWC